MSKASDDCEQERLNIFFTHLPRNVAGILNLVINRHFDDFVLWYMINLFMYYSLWYMINLFMYFSVSVCPSWNLKTYLIIFISLLFLKLSKLKPINVLFSMFCPKIIFVHSCQSQDKIWWGPMKSYPFVHLFLWMDFSLDLVFFLSETLLEVETQ